MKTKFWIFIDRSLLGLKMTGADGLGAARYSESNEGFGLENINISRQLQWALLIFSTVCRSMWIDLRTQAPCFKMPNPPLDDASLQEKTWQPSSVTIFVHFSTLITAGVPLNEVQDNDARPMDSFGQPFGPIGGDSSDAETFGTVFGVGFQKPSLPSSRLLLLSSGLHEPQNAKSPRRPPQLPLFFLCWKSSPGHLHLPGKGFLGSLQIPGKVFLHLLQPPPQIIPHISHVKRAPPIFMIEGAEPPPHQIHPLFQSLDPRLPLSSAVATPHRDMKVRYRGGLEPKEKATKSISMPSQSNAQNAFSKFL